VWFGITNIQLVVAVLGIVNSLTLSIIDRKRELGILRAIGGLPPQIGGSIWMEALAIATVGLIMGIGLGAINLYDQIGINAPGLQRMPLTYTFPWTIAAILMPMILDRVLAGIGPGKGICTGLFGGGTRS
jgi:putative ABC transport system permease protein